MDVKDHLPLSELQRLERVEKNAERAKRLRIVILEQFSVPCSVA